MATANAIAKMAMTLMKRACVLRGKRSVIGSDVAAAAAVIKMHRYHKLKLFFCVSPDSIRLSTVSENPIATKIRLFLFFFTEKSRLHYIFWMNELSDRMLVDEPHFFCQ